VYSNILEQPCSNNLVREVAMAVRLFSRCLNQVRAPLLSFPLRKSILSCTRGKYCNIVCILILWCALCSSLILFHTQHKDMVPTCIHITSRYKKHLFSCNKTDFIHFYSQQKAKLLLDKKNYLNLGATFRRYYQSSFSKSK